jgi:hypothetical protein
MRWGVLIVAVLAAAPVRAELQRVGPCLVDKADREAVVVEATLVAIDQPAYRCIPSTMNPQAWMDILDAVSRETPTPETGCAVLVDRPACQAPVELDGAPRTATSNADALRICALTPGTHVVTTCTARGTVRCELVIAAGRAAVAQIEPVPVRARLVIQRVLRGAAVPDTTVTVEPVAVAEVDRVSLPARATYAWRAGSEPPRARVCESKPAAPGCTRCQTAVADPTSMLVALLVASRLVRRRRR